MTKTRIPDHSVTGAGETTIVLLHGAFGAKEYWRAQIVALVAVGYRVLAWDAPGYGLSPLPSPFSVEVAAQALGRLLDVAGGARNILVGHSMGGMIAQRAFGLFPDKISGLILSATSAAFGKPDGEWQQQFVRDRVAPLDAGQSIVEYTPGMLRQMMAKGAGGPAVDLVINTVGTMREETFRAAITAIVHYDGRDVLPKINVPTLCIAGEGDRTAPAAVMEKMTTKIAGAEFVCMPDVGHFGWAEQPEAFNGIVLDFLRRRF